MSKALQVYQQQLLERPLRTFALQSGTMFTLGDIVAQQLVEKKGLENHDYARSLRMTFWGSVIAGPLIGSWLGFLGRAVKVQNRVGAAVIQLTIDSLVFTPPYQALFFTTMSVLEGRTMEELKEKFRSSYAAVIYNSYRLWPAVTFFNFMFTPAPYRPLVNSFVAVGWNAYLSYQNQIALQLAREMNHHPTPSPTSLIHSVSTSNNSLHQAS